MNVAAAPARRPRPAASLAATLCVTAGVLFAPASPAAAADYSHAERNFAGSQIAAHEGTQGTPSAATQRADRTWGHDVSGHQGPVDWQAGAALGARFVYVKATEGTGYTNPHFSQQYDGAHGVGMTRGAYHFGRPDVSAGGAQADYFVDHGGGWTADGRTLPGALDVEYNPYGDTCYGLDPAAMSAWIKDFSDVYQARTGRAPTIYTSTSWWQQCTGGNATFGATNPLWIARYAEQVGELPAGWTTHTIWQFANSGTLVGDQNYLNGSPANLTGLALG